MSTKLFKSEDKRRVINPNFDTVPTFAHIFNYESSREFIENKIVLDVGCWSGQFERLSYKRAKKMTGIDSNPQAILFAKKELPGVEFKVATADNLPFPKSTFDSVFLMDVIEHVPAGSEEEVLKQIHRVTKKGGSLIITTPNNHPLAIFLDPAYFLLGHRHYNIDKITKMLTSQGFKIKKSRLVGNSYSLIYSTVSLLFKYTLGFEPNFLRRFNFY